MLGVVIALLRCRSLNLELAAFVGILLPLQQHTNTEMMAHTAVFSFCMALGSVCAASLLPPSHLLSPHSYRYIV